MSSHHRFEILVKRATWVRYAHPINIHTLNGFHVFTHHLVFLVIASYRNLTIDLASLCSSMLLIRKYQIYIYRQSSQPCLVWVFPFDKEHCILWPICIYYLVLFLVLTFYLKPSLYYFFLGRCNATNRILLCSSPYVAKVGLPGHTGLVS